MPKADDCFYFDESNCHSVGLARGIAGMVVAVIAIMALIIILALRAFKKYSQRLFLYLTLATLLHAPIYIMEVLAVDCKNKHTEYNYPVAREPLCTITGAFDMYTSWLQNLIVLWITGYLFCVVVLRKFFNTRMIEIVVVIFFLFVPLPAALIPLIKNKYGVSGAWCWISYYKNGSCHKIDYLGLGYQLSLWYVPFFVETIAVLVTVISISVVFIKRGYTQQVYELFHEDYRRQMKESLPLLIFPVVYCIINIFEIALDLLGIKFTKIYLLWAIDAVINPTKAIFVIAGYLASIGWIKQKAWRRKKNSIVIEASRHTDYETPTYGSTISPSNSLITVTTSFTFE